MERNILPGPGFGAKQRFPWVFDRKAVSGRGEERKTSSAYMYPGLESFGGSKWRGHSCGECGEGTARRGGAAAQGGTGATPRAAGIRRPGFWSARGAGYSCHKPELCSLLKWLAPQLFENPRGLGDKWSKSGRANRPVLELSDRCD